MNDILARLSNKASDKVPIWLMRQAGRYMNEYNIVKNRFTDFMTMCKNIEAVIEITMQPIDKFDLDAGIIFSDILVLLECIGMKVTFVPDKGPLISYENLEEILDNFEKKTNTAKLNNIYEAINILSEKLRKKKKPLLGFSGARWTLATYAIEKQITKDHIRVKKFSYEKPLLMDKFIDQLSEIIIIHLINQIKAGASAVQIFDTHANNMDHKLFEKYFVKKIKYITKKVKAACPDAPILLFSKGNIVLEEDFYSNIDAISFSSHYNMSHYINKIPKKVCFQGNLDPILLLRGGGIMKERALDILNSMEGKNFIFNLGHGILKETPTKNVIELVNIVKSFKN